jgi:hypothetical protein
MACGLGPDWPIQHVSAGHTGDIIASKIDSFEQTAVFEKQESTLAQDILCEGIATSCFPTKSERT